jgi:hypothetical protein
VIGKTISYYRILDKLGAGAADSSRITGHSELAWDASLTSSRQTLLDYGIMQRIVRVIGREAPL